MKLFEQIIEILNAHIKRLWILIFSSGFFLIVLLGLGIFWWWIGPELEEHLLDLIDSGLRYLIDSNLGYLIGGVLLFWQIAVASRRATAAEETAKAMQKTAELNEKGNIAERFKNAIEHLGNDFSSVRLDGIYALHYIAQEVEEYRKRVFEILCAYIRGTTIKDGHKTLEQTSKEYIKGKQPAIQIQSILNLLFIEAQGQEIYKEFRGNLKGANPCEANLQNAILWNANLQDAFLWRTNLQNADLRGAKLQNADLWKANLQNADLREANLLDAVLRFTNLLDANLEKANLQNASLSEANLKNAHLQDANLQDADLRKTKLQNADLCNADLTNAKKLTVKQLLEAKTLYMAKLPDGMEEEIEQKRPELFNDPDAKQES